MAKSLLSCLLIIASVVGHAQTITGPAINSLYTWPAMTSAGASATTLANYDANGAPSSFTIDAVTTGTAPTTCTFEVESSPDNVNWNTGSGSVSGPLDCHSPGVLTTSFFAKPVWYLRMKITALTGGDGTTKVTFSYIRGRS
jgi:hypothetical protein